MQAIMKATRKIRGPVGTQLTKVTDINWRLHYAYLPQMLGHLQRMNQTLTFKKDNGRKKERKKGKRDQVLWFPC